MAVLSQLQQQQLLQMVAALAPAETGCGANQPAALLQQIMPPTLFTDSQNELYCNMSASRKRARDEQPLPSMGAMFQQQQQQQQHMHRQFLLQTQQRLLLDQIHGKTSQAAAELPLDSSRLAESAMTSTSGRPSLVTPLARPGYDSNIGASNTGLIPMLAYHSSDEVDDLVRHRAEQLRLGLEAAYKRQCTAVIAAVEQQALQRIAEKQAELEAAAKRNAELEERLRQAAAESQAWFDVARNNEALVAGLRSSLEQALLQKLGGNNSSSDHCAPGGDLSGAPEEGYGDSEEEAASAAASTAVHCFAPFAEASTAERAIGGRWGSSDALVCRPLVAD